MGIPPTKPIISFKKDRDPFLGLPKVCLGFKISQAVETRINEMTTKISFVDVVF